MTRNNGNFGLTAMGVFLFLGATMAAVAGITILFPGSFLDPIWRLNPEAGDRLRQLGRGIGLPFIGLSAAMFAAGIGWTKRQAWGWTLAVIVIASQVVGDLVNAIRGQLLKGAVGAAIAGMLLIYLLRPSVRGAFEHSDS